MSTLKVGVIGVGGIARTHMPGWEASPHAEVIAGADLAPAALENWGAQWNVGKLETDSAAVINDPDIDIIDVCTPNMYHAPLSIAALEAGKHVICEKPLAPTPADVQRMIEARDKSGKMLMTAQHFRFAGVSKALKAEIDGGALGDVYHARSWMLRRSGIPTSLAFLSRQHAGGGACIDIGVHILDLTLWMMGNPEPVSVTGVARREIASLEDRALRAAAESENVRRRADRSIENARKFALERFVEDLLPAVDSFERAVEAASGHAKGGASEASAMAEGIELSLKLLIGAMERQGIAVVDPIGAPCDPKEHEAMSMMESPEAEPGSVIEVFQKGDTVNGRLARPARVIIAKEPAPQADPEA